MFNIKFKLPIVNDSIEYKNEKNKSDGYYIKDGNKESIVDQGLNLRGKGKKNTSNLMYNQIHSTVTDFAKFLGLSTSVPFFNAT